MSQKRTQSGLSRHHKHRLAQELFWNSPEGKAEKRRLSAKAKSNWDKPIRHLMGNNPLRGETWIAHRNS